MKKLIVLFPLPGLLRLTTFIIILLTLPMASLISCAGAGSSSTETGYNSISFEKNLMVPIPEKESTITSLPCPASGSCNVVAYSAAAKQYSSDTSTSYFTAFAISNESRSQRLMIIIKDFNLFDSEKTFPTAEAISLDPAAGTVIQYINGTSISTYSGAAVSATINYEKVTSGTVTNAEGTAVDYYITTLTLTGGLSFGGFSASSGQKIVAMTYPYIEPTLY